PHCCASSTTSDNMIASGLPPGAILRGTGIARTRRLRPTRQKSSEARATMLLTLDSLNAASPADFVESLDGIFERSPWIVQAACNKRPFATLGALFNAMTEAVRSSDAARQLQLIKAHPDLASRIAAVTAASKAEQAGAGLEDLSKKDRERFDRL